MTALAGFIGFLVGVLTVAWIIQDFGLLGVAGTPGEPQPDCADCQRGIPKTASGTHHLSCSDDPRHGDYHAPCTARRLSSSPVGPQQEKQPTEEGT